MNTRRLILCLALAGCTEEPPSPAPAPPKEGIALETELGTLVGAYVVADDPAASGGKYVWEPGEPGTAGANDGYMEFTIPMEPGTYALWTRQKAMDPQSDSCRITWHPADPLELSGVADVEAYTWDLWESGEWMWERVILNRDRPTGRHTVWTFEKAVTTTLRIYNREDGSRIDALFITRNVEATDPAKANVPGAAK